jgi:hypothetical protein
MPLAYRRSDTGMDLIVSTSVLPSRCTPTHEAAHFVVGQTLGIPVADPVVGPDRRSGHVATLLQPLAPETDKRAFLAQFPPALVRKTAMARAVFCFAGLAAEAHLCRSHWAAQRIVAGGHTDLMQAQDALRDAACDDADLWICWQRARLAVERDWIAIRALAKTL